MDPKYLTPADLLQCACAMRQEAPLAEQKIWQHLRDRRLGGFKFRRQDPVPPFIADFICAELKLIVEVDGESHEEQPDYDARRTCAWSGTGTPSSASATRTRFGIPKAC